MPLVVVMDGQPLAVHADHLNTPRRLTDAGGRVRWQWAYSAFGEIPPQALAHAGQPLLDAYSLRYPGQVDDGNGLFYNFNRFYDARSGRYTQADPIGLDGGWNRFGYAEANPFSFFDPLGHQAAGLGPLRCVPGWPCTPRGPLRPPSPPICCDQEKLNECLKDIDPIAVAQCSASPNKVACIQGLLDATRVGACFAAHCKKNNGECGCQ